MSRTGSSHITCRFDLDYRVELIAGLAAAACAVEPETAAARHAWRSLPRGHDAVRLFAAMSEADWRHRTPAMIMLDFGPPPALEVVAHKDHYANAGKHDAIARLLPALRDYAVLPATRAYLESLSSRHKTQLSSARRRLGRIRYWGAVEAYLGTPLRHDYFFVLSPLVAGVNGQNVLYRRPGGGCDIYSLSSLEAAAATGADEFRSTAWHELCHIVVDGWTKEHAALFEPLSGLYALMRGRARSQYCGPPGWLHMVDEHVIRAVCARLEAKRRGEAAGQRVMERERRDGFVLVGPVYETLRRYEATRDRHRCLRDFYPALAETLARLLPRAARA